MVLSLEETPVKRISTKYLSRLQRRALRLIYAANRQDHTIPLIVKA